MKLSKNEIADLEFDADLMGFRLVYLPKPLDNNYFVLYHKEPVLTYIGHYSNLNDLNVAMQKNYVVK
ncbi:hypothetical protein EB118_19870 [bacterium]|nr:hypothetical protein [bacterium]NDD83975.1 hypothetical protein [bacterium]NDG32321.1 hypothetical protein [bacterium]